MADTATKEVEKTAEQTATQAASTEETNDQGVETKKADGTASSEAPKSKPNESVDYKAEYERVSKQLGQAEHTIVTLKKDAKKAPPVTEAADDDTEYTTAEELTKSIEQKAKADWDAREARLRKDLMSDTISEELSAVSQNADEQKLIQFHYEHSLRPTGMSRQAIRQDLKRARLLANESRLSRENEELKEALKAKNSTGSASAATNQDREVVEDEPKFSPQEEDLIARRAAAAGLSVKEYKRRNRSKLTNP